MSKEGELKKRTREIVPKIKKLYGYPPIQPFYQREVEKILDEAKAEIAHAIYGGTDLELREVLHKWFGWFGEQK